MSATDWIAAAQALFLAAAARYGWKAYGLAVTEHKEARKEASKAPLRALHADVVREYKRLANEVQRDVAGTSRVQEIAGKQQRLNIALAFLPPDEFNLVATKELATREPEQLNREAIENASTELLRLFTEIEDGKYSIRQVALKSIRVERSRDGET